MLVKYNVDEPWCSQLRTKYTVKNKRPPATHWWRQPMTIKLFSKVGKDCFFPVHQERKWYNKEKELHERLVYIPWDWKVPEDMLREQDEIYLKMWMDSFKWGLIVMKTWRGKGNMIVKMVEATQQRTLILTNSLNNVKGLVDRFSKFSNYEIGSFSSKKKDIKEITVTTHSSFIKKYWLFAWYFGCIIYDECDFRLTDKMIRALTMCDCESVFWMTWTPTRQDLDMKDLALFFWWLYYSELAKDDLNWYNILPRIMCVAYTDETKYVFQNFHELKDLLTSNKKRIALQCDMIEKTYKKETWVALLLVDRVKDCLVYNEELTNRGVHTCVVHGDTKTKDDEENIESICSTWWVIIWTYQKIGRGNDIPAISSIYLLFATKFHSSVVQAVGRWLRYFKWKENVNLYDWNDLPILRGQAYARRAVYRKEYPWMPIKIVKL